MLVAPLVDARAGTGEREGENEGWKKTTPAEEPKPSAHPQETYNSKAPPSSAII